MITNDVSDEMLAHNLSAQLGLIQRAYAKGDTKKINHALLTVIDLRRMVSKGTHEWLNEREDWHCRCDLGFGTD
ncbi:hypothetical protein [uncultured Roseobacter sp.]|uniref:hypothetical protein n=1 Tax=uncultured Roseobacter sp. TaxID=114847 RepID=UPI002626BDC8|nr:hypothetical protein [uncultured Roseobacter sp.]